MDRARRSRLGSPLMPDAFADNGHWVVWTVVFRQAGKSSDVHRRLYLECRPYCPNVLFQTFLGRIVDLPFFGRCA